MDYLFGLFPQQCIVAYNLVSILVLMDYLFGQGHCCFIISPSLVSILVLMDYLFGLLRQASTLLQEVGCFNPCSDGLPFWTTIRIRRLRILLGDFASFNPCSDGLPFWTRLLENCVDRNMLVSILVLMDYLFGPVLLLHSKPSSRAFQSLF